MAASVQSVAYTGYFQREVFYYLFQATKPIFFFSQLRHLLFPPSKCFLNFPYTGYGYILIHHQPLWQTTKHKKETKQKITTATPFFPPSLKNFLHFPFVYGVWVYPHTSPTSLANNQATTKIISIFFATKGGCLNPPPPPNTPLVYAPELSGDHSDAQLVTNEAIDTDMLTQWGSKVKGFNLSQDWYPWTVEKIWFQLVDVQILRILKWCSGMFYSKVIKVRGQKFQPSIFDTSTSWKYNNSLHGSLWNL